MKGDAESELCVPISKAFSSIPQGSKVIHPMEVKRAWPPSTLPKTNQKCFSNQFCDCDSGSDRSAPFCCFLLQLLPVLQTGTCVCHCRKPGRHARQRAKVAKPTKSKSDEGVAPKRCGVYPVLEGVARFSLHFYARSWWGISFLQSHLRASGTRSRPCKKHRCFCR